MTAGTVLFAGGGSGGHVLPNVAVAERLQEMVPGVVCRYLVSGRDVDAGIAKANGLDAVALRAMPMSVRPGGLVRFLKGWGPSVREVRGVIRAAKETGAVVMVASGGFVSAPAMQAAKAEGIWSCVVNLDATPGKASRFGARIARERFIVSDDAPEGWRGITPVVRRAFDDLPSAGDARERLGLDRDRKTLLVTGGSQGARSLNLAVAAALRIGVHGLRGWQALHQVGDGESSVVGSAYNAAGLSATLVAFIDDMPAAWAAADLAIGRGGAGTVGEAWASRTPLVVLPYPGHGDEHQLRNMAAMGKAGSAFAVMDRVDPARTGPALREELGSVLGDFEVVREAAAGLVEVDGAGVVAEVVARAVG